MRKIKNWWVYNCTIVSRSKEVYADWHFNFLFYGNVDEAFEFFLKKENFPNAMHYDIFFTPKWLSGPKINFFSCEAGEIHVTTHPSNSNFPNHYLDKTFSLKLSCLKHKGGYDVRKKTEFIKKFDHYVHDQRNQ